MIYLDNAATTIKKPDAVYDAVLDAMKHCGNSGRGMSDASLDASRKIYEARMCLTEFFGGEDADRLVFTANSTESLNIAIHGPMPARRRNSEHTMPVAIATLSDSDPRRSVG